MNTKTLPRLLYLAQELRSPVPTNLIKYLPQGEIINSIASYGLTGSELNLGLPRDQLEALIEEGARDGKAVEGEWRFIVAQLITDQLMDERETMKQADFLPKMEALSKFMTGQVSIITTEEGGFIDDSANPIEKWSSGFDPFDTIQEGFYQGLFIVMGPPGSGKTSHLISIAENMRRTGMASSIWLHQLEIPRRMFEYRLRPVVKRTKFRENDRIYYGMRSMQELLEAARKDPDPNRIIIHDSPDVLAPASGDDRRFDLENIFRDLVLLKSYCKAIFVASQPRRKDKRVKMESVAESWAKAWYADGIIGIQKMGSRGSNTLMRAAILKNRFGPCDFEIKYNYDMVTLTGELDGNRKAAAGWDEPDTSGEW